MTIIMDTKLTLMNLIIILDKIIIGEINQFTK